jgi:hypothetical protein
VANFFDLEPWGYKLQFEVNGQAYFLSFVEGEGRWYVFAPAPSGLRRIPVYVDAASYEQFGTERVISNLLS